MVMRGGTIDVAVVDVSVPIRSSCSPSSRYGAFSHRR